MRFSLVKRDHWYKKYVVRGMFRGDKGYFPYLGWCLKTRPPALGGFTTSGFYDAYMRKQGIAVKESPKFMLRLM